MHYVQELGDVLLEDEESLPWIISLTVTGLPRLPKMDDMILIEGIKYTISQVKPANRDLPNIILLFVYPERTFQEDNLAIISTDWYHQDNTILDIIYGGFPKEYSFDNEHWEKFRSYLKCPSDLGSTVNLYIKDANNTVVSTTITR